MLKAGKHLDLEAPCGLEWDDTVHVVGRLAGGTRDVSFGSAAQASDGASSLTPAVDATLAIDVEAKAEATPVEGSLITITGDAATSIDLESKAEVMPVEGLPPAMDKMCRDMTVLAHGKLCLAGSYALNRHLCEQGDFERAQWQPTDIDIFYSSGSGLDGDELRRRLSVMARSCQLQMLGVAAGVVDESQSMYDAFSKRPYATCLDDQDEACVAAFARKELMRLCSLEPARSRQCARRRCARTR